MIGIYIIETPETVAAARALRKKLAANDIKVGMRNGAAFISDNNLEDFDTVLALGCEKVAAAYEARNARIQAANDAGVFASTPVATVYRSIDELEAALFSDQQEPKDKPKAKKEK
ncbi:hypothetical protein [Immundisolibacter sp.]